MMGKRVRIALGMVALVCLGVWAWSWARAPGQSLALPGLVVAASAGGGYLIGRRGAGAARTRARPPSAGLGQADRGLVERFHSLYYDTGVFANTFWLGAAALKCPLDLWVYQEIIHETRPDVIVECGTAQGGSALFLASICDLLGKGQVMTVDIEESPGRPRHPRITYAHGSTTSPKVVAEVRRRVAGKERVMVILDSDHSKAHVLEELRTYSDLVTPGCYLIVEDTNLGHLVRSDFGPGPLEAVGEFLAARADLSPDPGREKFLMTFNPGGYLRKVS
jgi:cephalosporin hydroxylase